MTSTTQTTPGLERRVEPQLPQGVPAMLVRASGDRLVMLTNPAEDPGDVEASVRFLCAQADRLLDGQDPALTGTVHHDDDLALLEVPLSPRDALAEEVSR